MISRNRSTSSAAAMSIERTTSANSTVTCLYSAASAEAAWRPALVAELGVLPQLVPHDPHATPAVIRPRSSPRPRRCVLRSQAISPSRDSDPPSPGRQRRRRGPGPAARAAAAARCRASPDRHRPAAAANRSIASSASARSPSAPRSSSVSTRTPVPQNCHTRAVLPDAVSSTAVAHQRNGSIAVAAPGPLPRDQHSMTGNSPGCVRSRRHSRGPPP